MARRPRLNPPSPTGNDWQSWARQLNEYLVRQTDSEIVPEPVLLEHKATREAKASTDGVLMYNPQLGKAEIAVSNEWVPIATDNAVTFTSLILTLVLTDTYQNVPIANVPPILEAGTYQIIINVKATGTGGGAFFQLRMSRSGGGSFEGTENEIGNGETAYVPVALTISSDSPGSLTLEARGNAATISGNEITVTRIGQP